MSNPGVIINKRYRVNIHPNPEHVTPCCGRNIGADLLTNRPELQGITITVYRDAAGAIVDCGHCGIRNTFGEGIWGCRVLDGQHKGRTFAIPYTWLERLEDEDYGDD